MELVPNSLHENDYFTGFIRKYSAIPILYTQILNNFQFLVLIT